MSRATRPLRRVRGREREALRDVVLSAMRWPEERREQVGRRGGISLWWIGRLTRGLTGGRPAQLRRCLLGLPVSARAAGRILAAVGGCRKSTGRHVVALDQ